MAGFVVGFRCAHAHQIVGWAEPAKPNMGCPGDRQCWASCVSPTYAEQVVADQKVEESDEVEEVIMAFVNEYASDEDIVKFRLNEIWEEFYPFRKQRKFGGRRPDFTIDRDRSCFLLAVGHGTGEDGHLARFLLWWNEVQFVAYLRLSGGSPGLSDDPYVMRWQLEKIDFPTDSLVLKEQVIVLLKQALAVRGYWGAQEQRPNTVVEFDF